MAFNDDGKAWQASLQFEPTEPVFPRELERKIFEVAALTYRPCILQLVHVARRVRLWIEPILYSILMMARASPDHQYPPLDRFAKGGLGDTGQKKELERIGPYVRQILLQRVTVNEVMDVLKACPNVHHLALWKFEDNESQTALIPILKNLPIRSLSCSIEELFNPTPKIWSPLAFVFDHRPFQHLTHLNIINLFEVEWAKWEGLALLPKLTHLALNNKGAALASKIFEKCKTLKLLVLFIGHLNIAFPDDYHYDNVDDRLFVLPTRYAGRDSLYRWERGAQSGAENDEFWETVEEARENNRLMLGYTADPWNTGRPRAN